MEKYCEAQFERIDDILTDHNDRLNTHGKAIDEINLSMVAQQKDTLHLQEAIKLLTDSINKLINELNILKQAPGNKWDKIVWVIITLFVNYIFFSKAVIV